MVEEVAAGGGIQFATAAQWVGILRSLGSDADKVRFVPGGVSHALHVANREVVCGANLDELEVFALDFLTEAWLFRCQTCEHQTRLHAGLRPVTRP